MRDIQKQTDKLTYRQYDKSDKKAVTLANTRHIDNQINFIHNCKTKTTNNTWGTKTNINAI